MSANPSSPSTQETSSSSRNVHPRRWSTNAIVSLAVLVAVTFVDAQSDPIVTVSGGLVRGTLLDKGGAVFKGIPYAQPPVGDLRWREPSPLKPWTGVREARTFGAVCAQRSGQIPNAAEVSSEDCLFVNLWTPEWPSRSRKPVMVWVYGGGNRAGGTIREEFDGESLARHGVVVVTLNYRAGSFGFFAHPELTRESLHRASGNQGLLDQIAALRWVHDNVTVFGGDSDNVTLFGESSGSLNVNVLMTSPLSKGLFRRVIGQSGTVVRAEPPPTLAEAEQRGEALTARWPVPVRASIKDLRAVSTVDILQAEPTEQAPYLGISLDGHVVPKKPAEVFAAGQQHRVALILGSNAHERIPRSTPSPDLNKTISEAYGPIAERAQALYGKPDPDYRTPENQWATDTSFRCSAVAQLVWHAAARLAAFEYEFARVPPGREELGSTHASELSYVFGNLDRRIAGVGPPVRPTSVDTRISEVMQKYWTNFAKKGNPNGPGLPAWPPFTSTARAYLQFTDGGPVAKEKLRGPFCDLFIESVERLMAK